MFSQQNNTQYMLSVKHVLFTTRRLGTLYNSQPKHVRFFSSQGDGLPWANLSQLPPKSCWQARAWYFFPVQCHLWVRIAKQKPLLICIGFPVHFLFLIHSDTTKGDIFMLFSLRNLLFCLQSSFFSTHVLSWKVPNNLASAFLTLYTVLHTQLTSEMWRAEQAVAHQDWRSQGFSPQHPRLTCVWTVLF